MKNYYEILELNEKASDEIIKKVFRMHVKRNHPDLFEGIEKEKAELRIKEYNEAYEVLGNKEKKKTYDNELIESNNLLLQTIKEENEYLKRVIKNKNEAIKEYLENIGANNILEEKYEMETGINDNMYHVDNDYKIYEKTSEMKINENIKNIISMIVTIVLIGIILMIFTDINIFRVFLNVF
ncbi:MAG: DnaJ domain-containing protein [Clostridia bacterium]|nr:DnaJ domain-containing protein [Clostridia bacterium]